MQKQSIAISDTHGPVAATPLLYGMTVVANKTQILPAGHHQGEC
jgi:hypothetical protein